MVKEIYASGDFSVGSLAWADSISLPVPHVRIIMKTFGTTPNERKALYEAVGLSEAELNDPDYVMPLRFIIPLIHNLEKRAGPEWFLNVPTLWSVDMHSEIGMAMRVASSFANAIDVLTEFSQVRWTMRTIVANRSSMGLVLTIEPMISFPADLWRTILLLTALNFQTVARAIVQDDVQAISYHFPGDPPSFDGRVRSMIDGSVNWQHDRATITIPEQLLSAVPPLSSSASFAILISALREQLAATQRPHFIAPKVRHALATVTRGQADAAEIGIRIGLSRRTLERRLAAEGTSFRALLEESLKARLASLLSDPNLPTAEITERLGYTDESSMQRACRRWFGQSYSAMRKAYATGQSLPT